MRIGSTASVAVQLGKLAPSEQAQTPLVVTAHTPADAVKAVRMAIELHSPVQHKLRDYILDNRKTVPCDVIPPNTHGGKSVAICGAGPSLAGAIIDGVDDIIDLPRLDFEAIPASSSRILRGFGVVA